MAQETVQAVRQAELSAASKEKEAIQKKELILSEAQQEAKTMVDTLVKKALLQSEKKLRDANEKGSQRLEAARQKADQEVFLMKGMVQGKEQAAINFIISSLI